MRYPPSILEDIRARLPVSAVVGRRVKLTKAGREWRGLSPFNAEKSPSFYVNDQKQFYHCFSSGKHGDIFSFVMETEGLGFTEAVERLAGEAGVTLPKLTAEAVQQEKKRAGLSEALEFAAAFFRDELKGARGREARAYLTGRALGTGVIEKFGLGYAPNERFALRDHLAGKGVSSEVMIEAGLLIHGEDIAVPYDRFRDRVMFPIQDAKGRVIAFGGRALAKDAQAKYLNSPETSVFHKGQTVFNLHRARKAAHDTSALFLVEGYVDCIALDRAEVPNVVAPLGTALTDEQLQLVWRMVPQPTLCFDGDKAGLRAAHRAIDVALPHLGPSKTLQFIFLPEGQDPDDLLRNEGPEALRAALERPRPLVDVLFQREIERAPLTTPEQKADCEKRLFIAVSRIPDEDLKRHYRDAIREKLRELFRPAPQQRAPWQGRGSGRISGANGRFTAPEAPLTASDRLRRTDLFRKGSEISTREAALVLGPVNHPGILEAEAETLAELTLASAIARRLRAAILDAAALGSLDDLQGRDGVSLAGALVGAGHGEALRLVQQAAASVETWALPGVDFSHAIAAWREASHLHARQSFLNSEIDSVSRDLADHGGEDRFERLKALVQRRETVLGQE
jgi:DNA primase